MTKATFQGLPIVHISGSPKSSDYYSEGKGNEANPEEMHLGDWEITLSIIK